MNDPRRRCTRCSKRFVIGDAKHCALCSEKNRAYRARKQAEIPAGACRKCGGVSEAGFKACKSCRDKNTGYANQYRARDPKKASDYQKAYNRRRRQLVIDHYGGKCACCGEREIKFLAVDHEAGGGNKHRMHIGSGGAGIVEWVIRENFPKGFRVLCHNCNMAIGFYGSCPHQSSVKKVA